MDMNAAQFLSPPPKLPTKSKIRLAIVTGNRLLAEGIVTIANRAGYRSEFLATDMTDKQFRDPGKNPEWDVLVCDVDAMKFKCWQKVKRCKNIVSRMVILGNNNQTQYLKMLWSKSIGGLISKEETFAELHKAILAVNGQRRYCSPNLRESFESLEKTCSLTPRQFEIVSRVSRGESSKEIASALSIRCKTVENHRARIYTRMGVNSAAAMVNTVREEGWI